MTIEEFNRLLVQVAELAKCAGSKRIADELEALAVSLIPFSDRVISAALRTEIRASFGEEDLKMRFGRAFEFLRVFQKSAAHVGRAKDVKALQGMVTSLERPVASRRTPAPVQQPSQRAEKFLRALEGLKPDRAEFDNLLLRAAEAGLDLKDYNYLAAQYGRTKGKHRTIEAAIDALRDRFDGIVQRARKDREIEKLTRRKPA